MDFHRPNKRLHGQCQQAWIRIAWHTTVDNYDYADKTKLYGVTGLQPHDFAIFGYLVYGRKRRARLDRDQL